MKMRKLVLFIVFCCVSAIAQAGIIVTINVNPGSSTGAFTPGETVIADVFMEMTEATDSLGVFSFGVQYDQSELSFVSRQDFAFGVLGERIPNLANEPIGIVTNVNAFNFSANQLGPVGPIRVSSLEFLASNPSGDINDTDLLPGVFDLGADAFFDANFSDIASTVSFNGASVTAAAVPEPSSMVALASFAAVGGYLRRRRRNKVASNQAA